MTDYLETDDGKLLLHNGKLVIHNEACCCQCGCWQDSGETDKPASVVVTFDSVASCAGATSDPKCEDWINGSYTLDWQSGCNYQDFPAESACAFNVHSITLNLGDTTVGIQAHTCTYWECFRAGATHDAVCKGEVIDNERTCAPGDNARYGDSSGGTVGTCTIDSYVY